MGGGRIFYVYEHWRPDTDACFYVGKGKGARAHDMRRGRNRHHKFITAKLAAMGMCVEVRLFADCLSEKEALHTEIERISYWRAHDAQLANVTAGGDGSCGIRHPQHRRDAISRKLTGIVRSAETRAKISARLMGNQNGLGSKKSPEAIERTAKAHRGAKRSEETCKRISDAKKSWWAEKKLASVCEG